MALTNPGKYVTSKTIKMKAMNTAIGDNFAIRFKDYTDAGLPEKLAKHMALKLAKSDLENMEQLVNLEYSNLISMPCHESTRSHLLM